LVEKFPAEVMLAGSSAAAMKWLKLKIIFI
jgi:hypothetical protein